MAARTAQTGLQDPGEAASATFANSVAGGCIGYITRNTNAGPVSTGTLTDIGGVAVTFTANANRLLEVEFWCAAASNSDSTTYGQVAVVEGSNILSFATTGLSLAGVGTGPAICIKYLWRNPSAGSHSIKAQLARNAGSGSVTLAAGTDREMYLKVTDLGPNF